MFVPSPQHAMNQAGFAIASKRPCLLPSSVIHECQSDACGDHLWEQATFGVDYNNFSYFYLTCTLCACLLLGLTLLFTTPYTRTHTHARVIGLCADEERGYALSPPHIVAVGSKCYSTTSGYYSFANSPQPESKHHRHRSLLGSTYENRQLQ